MFDTNAGKSGDPIKPTLPRTRRLGLVLIREEGCVSISQVAVCPEKSNEVSMHYRIAGRVLLDKVTCF